MLEYIFAGQYAALDPRASFFLSRSQFRPCQKSPSQKMANRSDGNTMSGLPGNASTFFLKRRPERHNSRRNSTSCKVSRLLFWRLARLLVSEAGTSPLKEGVFRAIKNHSLEYLN